MKVRSVRMKLDSVKDTLWQIPKKAFHFFPFIRCKILLIFCDLTPCITDNTSSNCPLHLLQFLSSLLPIICRYSVQCCDENFPNISHRGYEEKQLNNPNHTPKLTNHILDNIRRGRGGGYKNTEIFVIFTGSLFFNSVVQIPINTVKNDNHPTKRATCISSKTKILHQKFIIFNSTVDCCQNITSFADYSTWVLRIADCVRCNSTYCYRTEC